MRNMYSKITAIFLFAFQPLIAVTYTWNDPPNVGENWSDAGNWTPAGPPAAGDTAVFGTVATTGAVNVAAADVTGNISFENTSATGRQFFTGPLSIDNLGSDSTITLTATNANSDAFFTLSLDLSNDLMLVNDSSHNLVFEGGMTETGGSRNVTITGAGSGNTQIKGSSDFAYTGTTTFNSNLLLIFTTPPAIAIPGPFIIAGGTVLYLDNDQIANTSDVSLTGASSNLNMNSQTDNFRSLNAQAGIVTVGSLTLNQGATTALTVGDGVQILTGSLVFSSAGAGITYNGTTSQATISSNITSTPTPFVFDIASGSSSTDVTFSGSYNGAGFTKNGAGNLVTSGAVTTTSNSFINAGTLTVTGTYAGGNTVTVASGATLKGTGTITQNLSIDGSLLPGTSIGTLTIVGDVAFNAGSVLEIELNPTAHDLVDITGSLTIAPNSTLQLIPEVGTYSFPFSIPIVTASGGITGTFTNVTTTLPLFANSVVYTADTIYLTVLQFADIIVSGNAAGVAHALDQLRGSNCSNISEILDNIDQIPSTEELNRVLLLMQPSALTSLAVTQQNATAYVTGALFNHINNPQDLHCTSRQSIPLSISIIALGANTRQKTKEFEPGYTAKSPGALLCVDSQMGRYGKLGGGIGYTYTNLHWRLHRGHSDTHSVYGAIYGNYLRKHYSIQGLLLGGYNLYNVRRSIDFTVANTIHSTAKSHHNGGEICGEIKLAAKATYNNAVFSPFIDISYMYLRENHLRETGAQSLNLRIKGKDADLLTSQAGIDISACFKNQNNHYFSPVLQLGIIRESRFFGKQEKAQFVCGGDPFTVKGIYPSRTLGKAQAGIKAAFANHNLSVIFQGKYKKGYNDQMVYAEYSHLF